MTGFDVTVLLIVGAAAVMGFLRGFVQEIIALFAWVFALVAIHLFHTPLAAWLVPHVHTESGAAVLAFALCAIVPYAGTKLLARTLGGATRNSVLGPIDRVLGFGFGAVKGTVLVVMGFSVLVLGYDTVWGPGGRPTWITASRTYPFINASSEALVKMIGKRHQAAEDAADASLSGGSGGGGDVTGDSGAATPDAGDATPAPVVHHARHHHKASGSE